ncbi:hypothetical protein [Hymenobacter sp. UV11]|uniref:hypothetical protein n=1 Tax=Hymenobacter sp. UV11 TaxID=1849735 RepID=UPI0034A08309
MRTNGYGRPPFPSKRELLNAIFYQLRAGSAWHLLLYDLLPGARCISSLKPGARTAPGTACSTVYGGKCAS